MARINISLERLTRSEFARQVATTLLSQGSVFVVSLVTVAITTRCLGPAGKGMLSIAMLLPALLAMMLGFGIGAANVYFAGSRKLPIAELTANSIAFVLVGTVVGVIVALTLWVSNLLPFVVPGVPGGYVFLGMISLPLTLLAQSQTTVLQGLRRIGILNILNFVQAALAVPLLLLFVVFLGMGVAGAILASLLGNAVVLIVVLWCTRREGGVFWPQWKPPVVRATLSYGLKAYVGNILQFFNYRLDVFILNAFLGPAGVGVYAVAVSLAELLWQLPNATAFVIFPKSSSSSRKTMNRVTPRVFWAVLMVSLIGGIGLALTGRFAILLLCSKRFEDAYVPMLAMLPGVVLLGAGKILGSDIAGRGFPQYNSIAAAVSLAATVVLDMLLIPNFGVLGASLATSIAYTITFLLSVVFYLIVSQRSEAELPLDAEASSV